MKFIEKGKETKTVYYEVINDTDGIMIKINEIIVAHLDNNGLCAVHLNNEQAETIEELGFELNKDKNELVTY